MTESNDQTVETGVWRTAHVFHAGHWFIRWLAWIVTHTVVLDDGTQEVRDSIRVEKVFIGRTEASVKKKLDRYLNKGCLK